MTASEKKVQKKERMLDLRARSCDVRRNKEERELFFLFFLIFQLIRHLSKDKSVFYSTFWFLAHPHLVLHICNRSSFM